ncbi:hypothetical protein [Singulisphaera sp. PoT]|uniref:hypothetical protein n=1 Tax=Singulisphaera sp. PoT TaxID=3411797 RepID=UPI003BF46705
MKLTDSRRFIYEDERIEVDEREISIWPDANSVIDATIGITRWQKRNNFQYLVATDRAAMLGWLEANAQEVLDGSR